jgi:hypothetical protein
MNAFLWWSGFLYWAALGAVTLIMLIGNARRAADFHFKGGSKGRAGHRSLHKASLH